MRNAVALLFLFVCVAFFNITFFLNLGRHFLVFDEFLIKPGIRQVPILKLSTFFFRRRYGEYHSLKIEKYTLPKPVP